MSEPLVKIWAVVLAAGKGRRMNSKTINKVAYKVLNKPMIVRVIDNLKSCGISNIIVVVGYAKESVKRLLPLEAIVVEQKKRLGTAHAVKIALSKIPDSALNILVLNGDDALFLTPELFSKLLKNHLERRAKVSLLTTVMNDPQGLGRVIRINGQVAGIIEEKNASPTQKKIKEVNAACYLFDHNFLNNNISLVRKDPVGGEYYIVDLVNIAYQKNMPIEGVEVSGINWRGINTIEELREAEKLLSRN